MALLVGYRAEVAEGGVDPARVVETLDEGKNSNLARSVVETACGCSQ